MQKEQLVIRRYCPQDLEQILRLFYQTVHTVNGAHYSAAQLDAWAPKNPDMGAWGDSLRQHESFVADLGGQIVGFGDLAAPDYFDRLYVHHAFQRRGIASAVSDAVEQCARQLGAASIHTQASITARPFFKQRGYRVIQAQEKWLRGEKFLNYIMQKDLEKSG